MLFTGTCGRQMFPCPGCQDSTKTFGIQGNTQKKGNLGDRHPLHQKPYRSANGITSGNRILPFLGTTSDPRLGVLISGDIAVKIATKSQREPVPRANPGTGDRQFSGGRAKGGLRSMNKRDEISLNVAYPVLTTLVDKFNMNTTP